MPSRFTLFGSNGFTVAHVAQLIGEALDTELSLRESSFKGGEYFFNRDSEGMEISVERHMPDEEGDYAEPGFSDYEVLVYVNYGKTAAEERIAALSGLHLLRVETV